MLIYTSGYVALHCVLSVRRVILSKYSSARVVIGNYPTQISNHNIVNESNLRDYKVASNVDRAV